MFRKNLFLIIPFLFINLLNVSADNVENNDDYLKLGGAIRFNTIVKNFEESNKSLDGSFDFDTFIVSADARKFGFDLSLQYRFYPGSKTHFFRHAYIGYQIGSKWYAKLGIIQKPFGIGEFASHNWFFQLPYYVGLEDRHALGLGTTYKNNRWTLDLAYFRQASPGGPISGQDCSVGMGRFSYAIMNTTGIVDNEVVSADIRELDQFNTRLRYQLTDDIELGASLQVGRIYNRTLDKSNWGANWAGHIVYDHNRWNFKGEVVGYNYNARSDEGQKLDAVQMGAYASSYDVAAKGIMYVAGLAYTIPIERKFLQAMTFYFDYGYLDKNISGYNGTHHMIPGMMLTMGPIYTYIDYAIGKNQPWFSSSFTGLAKGEKNARWNSRFNINIGYYF